MSNGKKKIIIQFDGICVLCSSTVRFLLKADRRKKFLFQTLQGIQETKEPDSVIVIDGEKRYEYADALLKIGNELGGIFILVNILRVLTPKLRNKLYRWIAKNRYAWFGTRNTCFLPEEKDRDRFI